MLAHKLADSQRKVWVLTTNDLLKVQLRQGYFSTNRQVAGSIDIFSVTDPNFLRTVMSGGVNLADVYLVVDEFDKFAKADRTLIFHGLKKTELVEAHTYHVESLRFMA
jgi:hypothetical protein